MPTLLRRSFLGQALAAPLLERSWKSAPPREYLQELAQLMRAAPVPGAVIGVVQDRKPAWIAPLGVRAAGSSDPVTASTLFQAASLTKQVTAYVAFALRAQAKLDFDRPLVSYVDDLPNPAARGVTVRLTGDGASAPTWSGVGDRGRLFTGFTLRPRVGSAHRLARDGPLR